MLVEQIFWKLDSILIGARLGAAMVAVYAIGVMFNKYFMAFATAISRVMMPDLVRRIDAGSDAAALTARLVEISRWQALVLMLVLFVILHVYAAIREDIMGSSSVVSTMISGHRTFKD